MNKKISMVLISLMAGFLCLTSCGSTKVAEPDYQTIEEAYYSHPEIVAVYDKQVAAILEVTGELFSDIKVYAKDNDLVYEYTMAGPLGVSAEDAAKNMEVQVLKMNDTIALLKAQMKKEFHYDKDFGVKYIYKESDGNEFFSHTF